MFHNVIIGLITDVSQRVNWFDHMIFHNLLIGFIADTALSFFNNTVITLCPVKYLLARGAVQYHNTNFRK